MDVSDVMPKLELRHLVGLLFPGMIFSITFLYAIDKLTSYTFLLNWKSVDSAYVSLLLFYLVTSGLVFGVCFHLFYLLYFQKPFRALGSIRGIILKYIKKDEKQEVNRSTLCNKKEGPYDITKCPAEFTDILLKAVNIDIDYKALYRNFFGSLYVSIFLSALVLILASWHKPQKILLSIALILILLAIFFGWIAERLREGMDITRQRLVSNLSDFLKLVKENYPEEVYEKILK